MRSILMLPAVLILLISGCATKTVDKKAEYLEQYRQFAYEHVKRMSSKDGDLVEVIKREALEGHTDPEFRRETSALFDKVFTEDRLDRLYRATADADTRALDETFTVKEAKFWLDFSISKKGRRFHERIFEIRDKFDLDRKVPRDKLIKVLASSIAAITQEFMKVAHLFDSKTGRRVQKKLGRFYRRIRIYQDEVAEDFEKEVEEALERLDS